MVQAAGSGATLTGDSAYTISGDADGPLTMKQNTSSCVDVGKCGNTMEKLTLTPIE